MTRAADLAKLIAGSSTLGGTGELVLKDVDTADGSSPKITFQTGDTDIAADDVLGTIDFQAPDEGTGTDAILVSAGVEAKAEGDFSSSSNATSLVLKTGASEAATEKVRITSAGRLGIGTNSPSVPLSVQSDSNASAVRLLGRSADDISELDFYEADNSTRLVRLQAQTTGFQIRTDTSAPLLFKTNNTLAQTIDATGAVTQPLQPSFYVDKTDSQQSLSVNSDQTINFNSEAYDTATAFASDTFTAPVTGKYYLNVGLLLGNPPTDASYMECAIVTSNRRIGMLCDYDAFDQTTVYWAQNFSCVVDMDANDTAAVRIYQAGGAANAFVYHNSASTYFCGILIG